MNKFTYLFTPSVSLAFFRIAFGLLMLFSHVRYVSMGWIDELLLKPSFHFTYWGFEWVKVGSPLLMYSVYGLLILLSFLITIGFCYRVVMLIFIIAFNYVQLIDKTYYLNHYYFISMLSFLLLFLPMSASYSVDALKNRAPKEVPLWMLWAIRIQIGSIYFFGGVCKLQSDWLFDAQPLKIWLNASSHLPIIGSLLTYTWVAFVISWLAMVFDLSAPFLLSFRNTRIYIYCVIIIFHIFTHLLFNIGIFPWVMILCALIFFPPEFHQKVFDFFSFNKIQISESTTHNLTRYAYTKISFYFCILILGFQLFMPFRHFLYPGNKLWTEQGFRYSVNIMLIEKTASILFFVVDKKTNKESIIPIEHYLTPLQIRMMSTQPDMILEFAQFLKKEYTKQFHTDVKVRTECYVSLNGKPSRLLIDSQVDLGSESESLKDKSWILK